MTELVTPRLRLRPARADDAEALHAIFRRPDAMRYWSTPPHRDLAQTQAWVDGMIAIPPDQGEDFIVEYGGNVIGKAGLFRFPEIGFILSPDHWGQGLAREALVAVIDRAFAVHRLDRIIADVDPRNAASCALLTRLGFGETGRRTAAWLVGDEWCDSIDFCLERFDWTLAQGHNVP